MSDITNMDETLVLLFKNETREQLERFTEIMLHLEQDPDQQGDVINELFRLAHNVKGSAGMMGLNELKEIMHQVENLFDGVRKTLITLDSEKIDDLIEFSDCVLKYIDGGHWDQAAEISPWKEKFHFQSEPDGLPKDRYNNNLILSEAEKQEVAIWQTSGKAVYGVELQFSLDANMKSASALVFVKYLEKYGSIYKMVPSIKELAAEKFDIFKAILFAENSLTPEQEQTVITYPVNDVLETRLRKWVYRPEEAKNETKAFQEIQEHQEQVTVGYGERSIRVEPGKIDKLVNNIGELLNIKANLKQLTQLGYQGRTTWEQLTKAVQKLDQLIAIFHEDVMDLRMVPVRQLFARFPKIIRDVAKRNNKQVELIIFGEDTEIDKQIAENLVDPLTHMIRNAVDHGLENGAERIAAGKPEVGRIKLGAYQDGDYIVISIGDDGKGLNPKQIRDKAVKNGLIKNDQQLSEDELIKLVFAPGFSTATKVSDISGRGVGMDVVANSINLLKGDIEVNTQLNRGTTFLLKVPLTLAIIQTLLVKIGDQSFGIPSGDVLESLIIQGNEVHTVADQMIYNWRQDAFPIIDLRKRFGVQNDTEADQIPLVVFKNGYGKMGLIVDELIGQEEVVIKQINPAFPNNPTIAGAAILGDGEIALMINVHSIQSN